MTGGDVELNNLQLRVDGLLLVFLSVYLTLVTAIERIFKGSGIYIKNGVLQHLRLHIPWTSLTSSPIVITIEGLELEAVAIDVRSPTC